jgi:hypothetical protein
MKLIRYIDILSKQSIIFYFLFIFLIINGFTVRAQFNPTVSISPDLDFGTFATTGAGGTITLTPGGIISSTGGITSTSISFHPATLHVNYLLRNHLSISYDSNISINRAGGGSMKLEPSSQTIFNRNYGSNNLDVNIGGILTIDKSSIDPPGYYSGSFNVKCTFNW